MVSALDSFRQAAIASGNTTLGERSIRLADSSVAELAECFESDGRAIVLTAEGRIDIFERGEWLEWM